MRRYGFHGLSYDFIAGELARTATGLAAGRVVVAHLGNGASMCAMQNGRSIASTMGFSALDGLPMGTRCGQLDPGVPLYLMDQKGMSARAISDLLYKQSGLLGLSGLSNDMRTLEAAGTREAAEAIDYIVFRCQRELGAMAAALGGIDALVFCGGIGENSRLIRARICERLAWMGIEIDHARNAANDRVISSDLARTTVMVIPTNEEWSSRAPSAPQPPIAKGCSMKGSLKPSVAADMIPDGASLMIGGFMAVGTPERLIDALVARRARDLTIIANDTAMPGKGIGKLITADAVQHVIASHIGLNPETQAKMIAGEITCELVPQGTLIERIRAGGMGLGGVLTPTGIGPRSNTASKSSRWKASASCSRRHLRPISR